MDRWIGRVALVTGASVGIGAGICRQLVKYGIKVVGCARNVDLIQAIAEEESVKACPGSLLSIKCDLREESDINEMFRKISSTYGRLDICINNAGLSHANSLLNGNANEWRSMLDVNVLALSICTKEAVTLMRKFNIDDGQIINISSVGAHKLGNFPFYCGTKSMVKILTEGLRQELRILKSHIRVSGISPGLVKTEFVHRMFNDDEKAEAYYKSKGALQVEDIAAAVIYILQSPPHVDVNEILIRHNEQEF